MNKSDRAQPKLPLAGLEPLSPARRRWLYAAVAGAATLAGSGLAWLNKSGQSEPAASPPALWDLSFESPGKSVLWMRGFAGKPLLLNFWATWCPPCIEEFPLLDRFYQLNASKGWQVLGLAVDHAIAVETFLRRVPVQFPVALAGPAGIELSKTLGNVGGGLPFTAVFGTAGQVLKRKIGRVSAQDLSQWSMPK